MRAALDSLQAGSPTIRQRFTMRFLTRSVVLIILAVMVGSQFVDRHRLFVDGMNSTLNDQVGYISVARNFADKNSLDSNLIYPSVLNQHFNRNSFYMPGHYWAMAAVFKVAGYSVSNSFVPSLCGYVVAGLLTFFIAYRLCGPSVGYYSCALYALFPLNLIYAWTALAEMDLIAAVVSAFSLFLLLPDRHKVWAGSLVLVLPLLFRETGIVIGLIMAAMLFSNHKWTRTTLFCMLSCLVFLLVLSSPAATGRPSLWGPNILCRGHFDAVYADAFAVERIHPVAWDWVVAVKDKFFSNLQELLLLNSPKPPLFEYLSMYCILSGIPLGFLLWWRERKPFMLGVSAMVFLLLLLDLCFYSVWLIRGTKSLLVCQPFVAVLWAYLFDRLIKRRTASKWLSEVGVLVLFIVGISGMRSVFRHEAQINERSARDTAFLESIVDDDGGLLVSPWQLSLDYVNKHHPVRWAFIPANFETLKLLNERYLISTLVLPLTNKDLQRVEILGVGLSLVAEQNYRGTTFQVFKRRGAPSLNGDRPRLN